MKKGFTLIELLAVIVILAIIATIATPIVLNIINDTKESSLLRSAEFYLNAVEQSITQLNADNGGNFNPKSCEIEENGNIICDKNKDNVIALKLDGEKPDDGVITIENGKINKVELYYKDKLITNKESKKLEYSPVIFVKVEDSNPGIICGEELKEDLKQEVCYIKSIEDLVELSTLVNKGTTFENKKVELIYSLDFNSRRSYVSKEVNESLITREGFTPIGSSSSKAFKGTFEGNNNTIKGLYINRPETSYVGLFGMTVSAAIQNLKFENCEIAAKSILGCLSGQLGSNTEVKNIEAQNITSFGETGVGGLVGYCISSNVSNINTSDVTVDSSGPNTGGLYSYAKNCKTNKTLLNNIFVKSKGSHAGGLIGGNQGGEIYNIKMNRIVVDAIEGNVGGVIGTNMGAEINNIKINVDLFGNPYNAGLVVGNNSGNVTNVAASGNFNARGGAFIGANSGTTDNIISITGVVLYGNITGSRKLIGSSSNANLNLLFSKEILFNNKILESNDPTSVTGKSLDNMGKVSQSDYETLGFNFDHASEAYWYFNENDELDLMIK